MKKVGTLGVMLALALALAACGGDGGAKFTAACAGQVELFRGIEATVEVLEAEGPPGGAGPPPGGAGPPPERGTPSPELARQMRAVYDEKSLPALAKIRANASGEIKDDVERTRQTLTDFRNTLDFDKTIGSKEFDQLTQRINAHFFPNCPGSKAAVELADHGFRNLPTELKAGVIRFQLENVGKEIHDLAFLSRKPGVTESLDEILSLPPHEMDTKLNVKSGGFALPGGTSYALIDLAAGDYLAVCFIPQGTTQQQNGKGPAHFTLGMRQDVKVT